MHLFCPSSSAWQSEGFVIFLSSQGKTRWTIKQIKNYALKYGHVLDTGNASMLMTLSPRNRHHALSALASLSKYQGRYQEFLQMRHRYNLKWTSGNDSIESFERLFDGLDFDTMLARIKEMIRILPARYAAIIKFNCLTGLRPSEACEAVRLLLNSVHPGVQKDTRTFSGTQVPKYYNPERQCLEHWRFPQFQRATKKCYISFITKEMLSAIGLLGSSTPSWNAIRLACRHRGINMNMHLCRKLFASWLYHCNIPETTIDLLQGRVPRSVFARHYLVLNKSSLKDDVLQALEKLQHQL